MDQVYSDVCKDVKNVPSCLAVRISSGRLAGIKDWTSVSVLNSFAVTRLPICLKCVDYVAVLAGEADGYVLIF